MLSERKKNIIIPTVLYLVLFIIELYLVAVENKSMEVMVKPFLMTTLLVMYITSVEKINYYYLVVLFLVLVGDHFIIFKESSTSLHIAINSFTLANIFYFVIFWKDFKKLSTKIIAYSFIPFVFSVGLIFMLVSNELGEFFYTVLIHIAVVTMFGNMFFLNYLYNNSSKVNFWLFIGFFMFIVGDCLFGIYRFLYSHNMYVLLVVSFYTVAQYVVCRAMIKKTHK